MEETAEKVLFKNKTIYTKELYLNFNKFHLRTRNKALSISLYICMGIMIISSLLLIFLKLDISAGVTFLILSAVIVLSYIYLPNISVNRILKFDKTFENNENQYKFYENEFEVSNPFGNTKIKYEDLYRVYDTKEVLYIYINTRQAFLISKSGFNEDLENAIEFLKTKFKSNYIKK
ncbi:MAG: YcxB family protein [Clostridia bacterium]|nr:YcxB family protein [Clostridia bacterium]